MQRQYCPTIPETEKRNTSCGATKLRSREAGNPAVGIQHSAKAEHRQSAVSIQHLAKARAKTKSKQETGHKRIVTKAAQKLEPDRRKVPETRIFVEQGSTCTLRLCGKAY